MKETSPQRRSYELGTICGKLSVIERRAAERKDDDIENLAGAIRYLAECMLEEGKRAGDGR